MRNTNPFSGFSSPSLSHALSIIKDNPESGFRNLRETISKMEGPNSSVGNDSITLARDFADNVGKSAHALMVLEGHDQSFSANWEFARFLDRLGRQEEALTYLELAKAHDPDHPKVLARETEILLALHAIYPNDGYGRDAYLTALDVWQVEDSDYIRSLMLKVEDALPYDVREAIHDEVLRIDYMEPESVTELSDQSACSALLPSDGAEYDSLG